MAIRIDNVMVSFVIFSILVTLCISFYDGLATNYGFTSNDVDDDNKTIMEALRDINVISGMADIQTNLHKVSAGSSSKADIVGGLLAAGLGFIKVATGLLILPIEIFGVITGFYYLPESVSIGLGLIFAIYLGYILIRNATGGAQ